MLSLYRRHRPRTFDSVVGQEHIVRTLRNAIELDKVHHAYLFVGSRGTGKTSMAKLLACALNAEGGARADFDPESPTAKAILAGTSLDVVEMDAASNNSVDDIRELRENVALAPMQGGRRVYILDEAHMLSTAAWNAFLKTLEEPPPHVVFVLATTEAHKVMATIADRCQRFDFQRPSIEQISEVLERVAAAEGIEVEKGATAMIARSASGSFRDALGTLDQLVAFGGERVELDAVMELIGAADAEMLFEAVDAVVAEDPRGVLLGVDGMARSGRDPALFARDLLGHLRHLLVIQTVGEVPATFVVTASDEGRLSAQAAAIGPAMLVRTIDELAAALTAVREGDDARLAVEIALLKAARPDIDSSTEGLARRIERLEKGVGGGAGPRVLSEDEGGAAAQSGKPGADEADPHPSADADVAAGGADSGDPPEEAAEPPSKGGGNQIGDRTRSPDALGLDELVRIWPAVLDRLRETSPALAATFDGARPVGLDEDGLKIGFPAKFTFNKRKAEAPDKRDQVADAIEGVAGTRLRPVYVLLDGEGAAEGGEARAEVDQEALVEKLKSEFNAEEVG
jgi:DNA polymerase III subunit gamma/tau